MKLNVLNHAVLETEINLRDNKEYIIGRDRTCDIVLHSNQISRKHARLFYQEGAWQVELLSKTGSLKKNQLEINMASVGDRDNLQIASYVLSFVEKDTAAQPNRDIEEGPSYIPPGENDFEIHEESANLEFDASSNFDAASSFQNQDAGMAKEQESNSYVEEEIDTETTAGGNVQLENQLRIVYAGRKQTQVSIQGNFWTLGRSENCDLKLKDSKASRKHVVIKNVQGKFQVKDLGSSNGTFLNGNQMQANKDYPLRSGDCIEIGTTKIYFEQVDVRFEEAMERLPVKLSQHPLLQVGTDGNLNTAQALPPALLAKAGELGFVRPQEDFSKAKKKPSPVLWLAIGLIGIAGYFAMQDDTGSTGNAEQASIEKEKPKTPFEALSPSEQIYVNTAYQAAYRFFAADQWDLCISELEKVHRFLPNGHSDPNFPEALPSLQMLNIADTAAATLRDQARLEEEKRQRQEFERELENRLRQCEQNANAFSKAQAEQCLEFVFLHSPDNPRGKALLEAIDLREEQKVLARRQQAERQSLIEKGESLFRSAEQLDQANDILEAIEAYQKHAQSSYPDPNGLKKKSSARASQLQANIAVEIEKLVEKMRSHFETDDQLKDCVKIADKILKLNSSHAEANDLRNQAIARLTEKLREDYQDSIFRESHGDIEKAKQIWRQIVAMDIEGGEYHTKASIKLKKHGGL